LLCKEVTANNSGTSKHVQTFLFYSLKDLERKSSLSCHLCHLLYDDYRYKQRGSLTQPPSQPLNKTTPEAVETNTELEAQLYNYDTGLSLQLRCKDGKEKPVVAEVTFVVSTRPGTLTVSYFCLAER
jgi:hypothetical protein